MRHRLLGCLAFGAFLVPVHFAAAQSSLDALEQELKDAKQQHQDLTAQTLDNFFQQVDAGMASPDAALALYQQAGGQMPPPAPVVTTHQNETVTEKEARQAIDQANAARLALVLQLHCGLLHFGATFVVKPNEPGLQDKWVEWLKSVAPIYQQIYAMAPSDDQGQQSQVSSSSTPRRHRKRDGDDGSGGGGGGGGNGGGGGGSPGPGLMGMDVRTLRESIISRFLSFRSWGDKEQGDWAVRLLPQLYRTNVLEPLRAKPTAATLAAWDVYIGMLNAEEKDDNRWTQVTYPPLQFARGCDAYAVEPTTERLGDLINMIKANPTGNKVDDWIDKVHQLMDDYRTRHGGVASAAQAQMPATNAAGATPPANSNTTVTTEQQGDMTIITTKPNTNGASATPPPAQ